MKKSFLIFLIYAICGLPVSMLAKPEWLTAPVGAGAVVSTGIGVATYNAYQKMLKAKEAFELADSAENEAEYLQASSRFKKLMGASVLSVLVTGILAAMQKKTEVLAGGIARTGAVVSISHSVTNQSAGEAISGNSEMSTASYVTQQPYVSQVPDVARARTNDLTQYVTPGHSAPPAPRYFPVPAAPASSIAQESFITVRNWVMHSDVEKVKKYLDAGGNPNAGASYEKYGLLDSAKDHKTANLLLQKGGRSRDKEYFELMCLPDIFRSALSDRIGGGEESLRVLKEHGFDLNGWRGTYGTTFLSDMVQEGKFNDIKLILSTPLADVNAKNKDGSTALDRALGVGNLNLGKYKEAAVLLEHGGKGAHPGSYALGKIEVLLRKALADKVDGPAALAVLDKHGIGINTPVVESLDDWSILLTLLSEAAEDGDLGQFVRLLSVERVDINARNSDGSTALMCAVLARKPAIISSLGKNPDAMLQRNDGATALMLAIEHDLSIVDQLLDCSRAWKMDLNVNAVNKTGKTALDIAIEKGLNQTWIDHFKQYGAKTAVELKG